jgi:hypothetical protein
MTPRATESGTGGYLLHGRRAIPTRLVHSDSPLRLTAVPAVGHSEATVVTVWVDRSDRVTLITVGPEELVDSPERYYRMRDAQWSVRIPRSILAEDLTEGTLLRLVMDPCVARDTHAEDTR